MRATSDHDRHIQVRPLVAAKKPTRAPLAIALLSAGLCLGVGVQDVEAKGAAPKCKASKGKPRAFVRPKTPLRRGPGLNYPVSSFLEKGGCLAFSQMSADEQWVLVEKGTTVGWVPVSRLSRASAEKVKSGDTPKAEPSIGSGQTRGKATVQRQAMLLAEPDSQSPPKRVLPKNLEVLPLSVTESGRWVEVRDDRGQTGWVLMTNLEGTDLATLPVSQTGFDKDVVGVGTSTQSGGTMFGGTSVGTRPGRRGVGVALTAAVFAGALQPIHSLDSNANGGRRRYTLSALAPAVGIDVEVTDLGPLAVRMGYTFAFLNGVAPENVNQGATGQQHDINLRLGLPLAAGPMLITPELGYSMAIFEFSAALPDNPGIPTIVSNTGHLATVGTRFQVFVSDSVMLEADGGLLVGATQERPRDLGANGISLGGQGSVGLQYFMSDLMGLTVRYGGSYRTTSYDGASNLDSSLTQAKTTDASHGLLLGLSFLLAG